jgi:fumarate hydratase class II
MTGLLRFPVSQKAHKSGKTIREVLLEEKILSEKEFDEWLKGQFE